MTLPNQPDYNTQNKISYSTGSNNYMCKICDYRLEYCICKKYKRIRVKNGWECNGLGGFCLGDSIEVSGTKWTPVLFDGFEDPEFFKTEGLENV